MNETEWIEIKAEEALTRLDKLLANRYHPHFSRTYFADLIDEGLVLINGELAKKRIVPIVGDQIEVCFREREPSDILPENIPLDLIYEDEWLLVVNKPAGMVVHPAVGNWSHTFVNALLYYCSLEKDGSLRPGIVHRLDKDTTGVLVAAKSLEAQKRLVALFSSREVYKEYIAITVGSPKEGKLETLIGRNPRSRQEMAVVEENGKKAVTLFKILEKKGDLVKVEAQIETGRTHQIRVHLKHLKTPVLGDPLYGRDYDNKRLKALRPYLHAFKISFIHPFLNKKVEFSAPLPKDMECAF